MKLHLYPNWKAKQQVFSYFYKGIGLEDFQAKCRTFFESSKGLVYEQARKKIAEHKKNGDIVVIESASMEDWVKPFANWLGADDVVGTKVEVENGKLTGRFLTKNCYGQEKVNRLLEKYPNRKEYILVAYGDSRGDKELLEFADKQYYKSFEK